MKKTLLLFAFLNILLSVNAQYWFDRPIIELDTARLCVMYQLTYMEDTVHRDRRQEKQMLITGYESSSYQSFNHHRNEMAGRQKVREGQLKQWLQSSSSASADYRFHFNYRIYKNHTVGSIITVDRVFMTGSFKYEEDKSIFNWEITSETDTIKGCISQKAICDFGGRHWEAWFTPEIPYSDGPYKFCGLPGLILKIADSKGHYNFEVLSVELTPSGTMVDYYGGDDYIVTTKKEYFKVYDDNLKNMIGAVNGSIDVGTTDFAQRAKKYAEAQNNPLELDRK